MNRKPTNAALAVHFAAFLVVGCADDDATLDTETTSETDGGTTTSTSSATSSATATTSSSTGSAGTDAETTGDVAPQILDIAIIANPISVLSATIELETDVDTTVTVVMTPSGGDPVVLPWTSETSTTHAIPVLGMKAETDHSFTVTVEDAEGRSAADESLSFLTEALPTDFPPIDVQIDDATAVSPGVTLFDVFRWAPGVDPGYGLILGLDASGEVVWYYRDDEGVQDVKPSMDGNLLVMNQDSDVIRKIDMMGNELFSVSAAELGIDSFHHEISELPNGNLVSLGTDLRNISGYEGGGTSYDVVADTIVEFTEDGTLVDEINFFDLYDPVNDYIDSLFDTPFWNPQYPEATGGTKDWTHGNAVIYDEEDDAYLVSLRHLLTLSKVSRATGELVWSLGVGRDFTFVGEESWPYAQHAPEFQADGSILMFDNGNLRPLAAMEDPYSRVARFTVDDNTMEVALAWSWQAPFFAPFVGDADRLPNGNVLVGAGGRVQDEASPPAAEGNRKFAQIIEITSDAVPAVVMTITISDESATDPIGYTVYRAERIPSLYQVE